MLTSVIDVKVDVAETGFLTIVDIASSTIGVVLIVVSLDGIAINLFSCVNDAVDIVSF